MEQARSAGLTSIDIPEFATVGVLVWRADLAGAGTATLAAWGAAKPTRRRWLLRLRRWTGTTVFAPHVGIGTLGEHHWGEITAVVLCGIVGFFTGGWSVGGPMSVTYGALVGAAVGLAAWWLFLVVGRRRIVGRPVNVDDPEVMALVVFLAGTGRRAARLRVPEPNLDIAWTAKELAYQVIDQALSDEEFAQLRYQAQMLDHAVNQALRAQGALDTVTEVHTDSGASPKVAAAAGHVADTSARLTAHAAGMDEIADHVRAVRRTWPNG